MSNQPQNGDSLRERVVRPAITVTLRRRGRRGRMVVGPLSANGSRELRLTVPRFKIQTRNLEGAENSATETDVAVPAREREERYDTKIAAKFQQEWNN